MISNNNNNVRMASLFNEDEESSESSQINLNITRSSYPKSSGKQTDSKNNTLTSKRLTLEKNPFLPSDS